MILGLIWIIGAVLLLAAALTVYDKLGEKLSNDAIILFFVISSFWPIFLITGLVLTSFNSYNARQLFRKTFK